MCGLDGTCNGGWNVGMEKLEPLGLKIACSSKFWASKGKLSQGHPRLYNHAIEMGERENKWAETSTYHIHKGDRTGPMVT